MSDGDFLLLVAAAWSMTGGVWLHLIPQPPTSVAYLVYGLPILALVTLAWWCR